VHLAIEPGALAVKDVGFPGVRKTVLALVAVVAAVIANTSVPCTERLRV
jgi:hypothetical protein